MNESTNKHELAKADLLDHTPDDLACVQCGGIFCGWRIGRVYEGKPLIMCGRKEEVQEILANIGRR